MVEAVHSASLSHIILARIVVVAGTGVIVDLPYPSPHVYMNRHPGNLQNGAAFLSVGERSVVQGKMEIVYCPSTS